MRTELPGEHEDHRLREVLQAWRVSAPLPLGFEAGVWHRISHEETASEFAWRRRVREWAARGRSLLIQPAGATAYLLVLLVFGAGLGYWQSEHYSARAESAWRNAYVHSVNPTAISLER